VRGGTAGGGPYISFNRVDQSALLAGGVAALSVAVCAIPGVGWASCAALVGIVTIAAYYVNEYGSLLHLEAQSPRVPQRTQRLLRVNGSSIGGFILTIAIPIVFLGASTLGWRRGGSRQRLLTFTLLGVVLACLAFALIGRIVDVESFTMTFVVVMVGLSAGTVMIGKKRLNLA
jgi:hypothetical protein